MSDFSFLDLLTGAGGGTASGFGITALWNKFFTESRFEKNESAIRAVEQKHDTAFEELENHMNDRLEKIKDKIQEDALFAARNFVTNQSLAVALEPVKNALNEIKITQSKIFEKLDSKEDKGRRGN